MGDLAACAWRALRLWVLACFDGEFPESAPAQPRISRPSGIYLPYTPRLTLAPERR